MTKEIKNLYFFTATYPYDHGETFIETEINYLSATFSKVVIIPLYAKTETARLVPDNCLVLKPLSFKRIGKKDKFFAIIRTLAFLPFWKEISKYSFLKRLREVASCFSYATLVSNELGNEAEGGFFYSYWLNKSSTIVSLLKFQGTKISRTHGHDLYFEKEKYYPLRDYTIQTLDKIFAVSKHGRDYLKNLHKNIDHIDYSYLGTVKYASEIEKTRKEDEVHFVSCSYIVAVKRIPLIAVTLQKLAVLMNLNISWTHIGGGDQTIKSEVDSILKDKPTNFTYRFLGNKPNHEVHDLLAKENFDFFINMSSSEGLPMSFMEAQSYGIACIAPKLNGIPEIVNDKNGILFDKDENPQSVALKIQNSLESGNLSELKMNSRKNWESNFNAKHNYKQFTQDLISNYEV